ncbi:unnamed protein product [Effrenium voratum]|nr:unnamed protein product [Effrenium voratum]
MDLAFSVGQVQPQVGLKGNALQGNLRRKAPTRSLPGREASRQEAPGKGPEDVEISGKIAPWRQAALRTRAPEPGWLIQFVVPSRDSLQLLWRSRGASGGGFGAARADRLLGVLARHPAANERRPKAVGTLERTAESLGPEARRVA